MANEEEPACPYSLLRHLAAIVAFPLVLAGVAEVIRVRGCRQTGL